MTPTAIKIKALRASTGLSQEKFQKQILGDLRTLITLRGWEAGRYHARLETIEAVEKRVSEYLKKS